MEALQFSIGGALTGSQPNNFFQGGVMVPEARSGSDGARDRLLGGVGFGQPHKKEQIFFFFWHKNQMHEPHVFFFN